jgi:hypothetical protein
MTAPDPQPPAAPETDVDALREALAAATPGPWRWAGNTDTGEPRLTGRGCDVLAIGYEPRSTTGRDADEVRSYARESGVDEDEAVDMWANDQYGEPIKEPRLWFYTDHLAVDAREHAVYEVAPEATSREDPRVYRADLVDLRHPDARLIVAAVNALPALLADLNAARERVRVVEGERDAAEQERDDWRYSAQGLAARAESAEAAHEALRKVLGEYFDFEVDSWDEGACPEPEDVWRLHRDLRALLAGDAR